MESGAWAEELLRSARLDGRDAALAWTLVFGVLRRRAQLDFWIDARTRGKLDPEVRQALRLGFLQLHFLERIPRHAAVSESVELIKAERKRSAAGLVNAVLKSKEPLPDWPDPAVRGSIPPWLYRRWVAQYGEETAARIAGAALREPEVFVHVRDRAELGARRFEETGVPGCYLLPDGDADPLRAQDIGSQWVVPLIELQPGQRHLDVCSAPGGKTRLALDTGARVIACDRYPHRLKPLAELGCPRVLLDATQPLPFGRRFDRILVDAPCSGTGTLARNPEIKWRLTPADLDDLHARQVAILRNALACLAPGGLLVYSTCSLEPEENEAVLAEAAPGLSGTVHRRLPGIDPGDGFFACVIRLS